LFWELTCLAWRYKGTAADPYAGEDLTRLAGDILKAGGRLPEPLRLWLADALLIALEEAKGTAQRASLGHALGLTAKRARPKYLDRARVRELVAAGMSQRDMAVELDVDRETVQNWLKEVRLSAEDEAALLRGLSLVAGLGRELSRPQE